MAKEQSTMDRKYEAEDAARTLVRAEEIKANPKLHKAAQSELSKQAKAIKKTLGSKKKK